MNLRLANQLTMAGACLTVANSADYKPVWLGKEPADFEADIAQLGADYGAVISKSAQAEASGGGAADAKAVAEEALENAAHVLARALANHFKKSGNLTNRAKVDVTKTEIVELRNQDLIAKTTEIRDLALAAQAEPGAAGRGVTAARTAVLTGAITSFSGLMSAPRGQIVNRSTLLKEVETDVASVVEQVRDLDDLVLQFDGSELGRRFIEAWKRARIIVDTGGGHAATPEPTPTPTPTPNP
jgi:hypothetical protein